MKYGLPVCITQEKPRSGRPIYIVLVPITIAGVTIPVGYLTDFVSAPEWIRKRLPLEKMARAALVHDYLCNMTDLPKSECNRIFRQVMKESGVSFCVRWGAWAWVSRPGSVRNRWNQPYIQQETAAWR